MKTGLLLTIGLLTLFATSTKSQQDLSKKQPGLIGKATIKSFTVEQDKSDSYINVDLTLSLVNTGTTPIIFWQPINHLKGPWEYGYWPTGRVLSRTPDFARADILYENWGGPSLNGSPAWVEMRKALDQKSPVTEVTTIVFPNKSLSFDAGARIPGDPYGRSRTLLKEMEDRGTVWLRVYYQVWDFDLEPDPWKNDNKFGRKLQERWKDYGHLWLDDIYSEPIKLDMKTATYKKSN